VRRVAHWTAVPSYNEPSRQGTKSPPPLTLPALPAAGFNWESRGSSTRSPLLLMPLLPCRCAPPALRPALQALQTVAGCHKDLGAAGQAVGLLEQQVRSARLRAQWV
jgi:hypothetical protein